MGRNCEITGITHGKNFREETFTELGRNLGIMEKILEGTVKKLLKDP